MLGRQLMIALVCGGVAWLTHTDWARAASMEEVKKMEQAMPASAPAKPKRPRKILIYSHCNAVRHGRAIEAAKIALPMLGAKTGAYTAVVSDDLDNFLPDKIQQYDAIVLNNTTGELFLPKPRHEPRKPDPAKISDPEKLKADNAKYEKALAEWKEYMAKAARADEVRKSFMDWVEAGGGVVGFHAATDCSYRWKEYGQLIGGYFSGHPWHALVPVKNDDPTNPINAAFEGKGFEVTDEIYQFNRGVYSREKQRVLLSLDYKKMQASDNQKLQRKGSREDGDYAISWIKTQGKGRVFYCSLGHQPGIFWNPVLLRHCLAGLQWVMGDLEGVETEPNPLKRE